MKQRIIVVDEKDNIIGYKESGTLNQEDIYRVSALWITNSQGEILLAKRHPEKKHDPNKWGPAVAGTVDEGEDYEENIIKEAEEEIGLKYPKFEKGPKKRIHGRYNYFCQWYFLEIDKSIDEFKIQEDEVDEIKWFSKEEILEMLNSKPNLFVQSVDQWIHEFL